MEKFEGTLRQVRNGGRFFLMYDEPIQREDGKRADGVVLSYKLKDYVGKRVRVTIEELEP